MRLLLFVVVLGAALLTACGGGDSDRLDALEARLDTLEVSVAGTVVGREIKTRTISLPGDAEELGVELEQLLKSCLGNDGCNTVLTVAFPGGATRPLNVSSDCYRLIAVGDPWPSDHQECR